MVIFHGYVSLPEGIHINRIVIFLEIHPPTSRWVIHGPSQQEDMISAVEKSVADEFSGNELEIGPMKYLDILTYGCGSKWKT
jgi:hypothetical protein